MAGLGAPRMAVGSAISQIKESLGITAAPEVVVEDQRSEDEKLVDALKHPAAQMQFTFIDSDEELQRVIEGGDFGAWRVFLHPDQRKYATRSTTAHSGSRAAPAPGRRSCSSTGPGNLAATEPNARVVLTTYTRALADNLRRDLERLDASVPFAERLGDSGVLVRGVDAARGIRSRAGRGGLRRSGRSRDRRGGRLGGPAGRQRCRMGCCGRRCGCGPRRCHAHEVVPLGRVLSR